MRRARSAQVSELAEGMALAAALPKIQAQETARLLPLLKRLPISHISDLADAIERFGDADYQSLMKVKNVKVRVALWYVDADNRCQRKAYNIGNTQKAQIGEIGDAQWIEGWIA